MTDLRQAEPVQELIVIPREDSQEAAKAIQAMLAEYQYPANPTNAARAGWRAARLYAAPPQQQAEPVAQRSDGMPISKMERELRRMLCIERHGRSAYMDDGEASFCGDKYCRSIDYMRESVDSIKQAWYDAGVKKLAGAQPEQQAEPPQEPFGYFRAEPFGWTDCAETDDGAVALYERPPHRKPLTIAEVEQILAQHNYESHGDRARYIVRMTEKTHGIKENT